MIDFVIAVRDRDNERIQRCINSLKGEVTNKIFVVDYASKEPVKIDGAEIIRIDRKFAWNKSHALNIGIKKCESDYIGTVDCDMVIHPKFMEKLKQQLNENNFVFTRKVYRIDPAEIFDWNLSWEQITKLGNSWRHEYDPYHAGIGGIQIMAKKVWEQIKGYDESMTYWGGMDNDIYDRVFRLGLSLVDLNEPIFHQEHLFKKEENLSNQKEAEDAYKKRTQRRTYLAAKNELNLIESPYEKWGDEEPELKEWLKYQPSQENKQTIMGANELKNLIENDKKA